MTTTKKIMIVDDDEDDIDFFTEAVAEILPTCKLVTASNGEEALEKLDEHIDTPPNWIFMDLNMPRMNGKICLIKLKTNPKLRDIPIIIYTTSSHLKEKEELFKMGASYFLTKSSTFDALKKEISKALSACGH